MRKRFMPDIMSVMLASSMVLTSCFGEFALVHKVYNWNDTVVDNAFVKTLLFYAMNIIPVYGIASAVDYFILNLVEFWSGSNPLAMNDGESEVKNLVHNGVSYEVEATKNQFAITPLEGEKAFQTEYLRFDDELNRWSHVNANEEVTPLVGHIQTEEGSVIELFMENGSLYINESEMEEADLQLMINAEGC